MFTLVDDGAGNFTFTLKDQVDHIPLNAASGDDDASGDAGLAKAFVVTDFDGDFVQLDNGAVVAIENDVPINNRTVLPSKTVFEDGLTLANSNNQSVGNPEAGHTADGDLHGGADLTLVNSARTSRQGEAGGRGAGDRGDGDRASQSKGPQVTWHVVSATELDGVRRPGCVHAGRRRRGELHVHAEGPG